jgi:hypothetical protein
VTANPWRNFIGAIIYLPERGPLRSCWTTSKARKFQEKLRISSDEKIILDSGKLRTVKALIFIIIQFFYIVLYVESRNQLQIMDEKNAGSSK